MKAEYNRANMTVFYWNFIIEFTYSSSSVGLISTVNSNGRMLSMREDPQMNRPYIPHQI